MKTKTIALKGFVDLSNNPMGWWDDERELECISVWNTSNLDDLNEKADTPVTITIEVPIPELKVEITESQFERFFGLANQEFSQEKVRAKLKELLFGKVKE